MPHDRFFVDTPFIPGEHVDLKDEGRHLKVMRIRPGDTIELVNGHGQLSEAKVIRATTAEILTLEERPSPLPVILCQALPRMGRLDTIVEKGTELGMTELWLFPGKLSEKKELSSNQLARLIHITIAAMKQCGRLDLPKIVVKPPLSKWEALPYRSYFGDLSAEAPPFLSVVKKREGICFFVGPETGFSADEEAKLMELGAQGVKLHPLILRTDTASLVALSLIYAKINRIRYRLDSGGGGPEPI